MTGDPITDLILWAVASAVVVLVVHFWPHIGGD